MYTSHIEICARKHDESVSTSHLKYFSSKGLRSQQTLSDPHFYFLILDPPYKRWSKILRYIAIPVIYSYTAKTRRNSLPVQLMLQLTFYISLGKQSIILILSIQKSEGEAVQSFLKYLHKLSLSSHNVPAFNKINDKDSNAAHQK